MASKLWTKFLVLLLAVAAVGLSAALILRELMVRDFRDYLEGDREDRAYWITADLERTYEKLGGWSPAALEEDALWALMLGFEIRVLAADGKLVADTETALASLSPLMKRRGLAALQARQRPPPQYVPYPLFLAGSRIGLLEVRRLELRKGTVFVERSNRFLLGSLLIMGVVALALSAVASRRLTRPLKQLASAAAAISEGDLSSRVPVSQRDEIGALAGTFNRMAHALQGVEQLRKKLLANVAHELRTPLGAMRAELEGMMDGLIPTGREQLQSLHDETGRLRRMLDEMEDLAHAQASALTISKRPVSLGPLLHDIVERARVNALDKDVHLALECDDRLVIQADPDKLGQIVLNVVDNAVKAVAAGGTVTVRASAGTGEVVVAVEDDGIGIDPADLAFIFERFYRRSEGGLGIGLAIVKELVEAHGGRIDVRSERGQGSVFTLHFPS
jgi:two-component system sensor histidine kinase BaeS